MSETPTIPPLDAAPAKSYRGWVWWCSDESIKDGKISLLAVAEIPIAMAFFGWLSIISPWPWMTLVGLMAAPLLLLRSPASIEDGLVRLRAYKDHDNIGIVERIALSVISFFGALLFTVLIRMALLSGYFGFDMALFVIILSSAATLFAPIVAVSLSGSGAARYWIVFAFIGAVTGGLVVGVTDVFMGVISLLLGITSIAFVVLSEKFIAEGMYIFQFLVFGLIVRVLYIRIVSTILNYCQGLSCYAHNWKETVLCVDAFHLPELMPGAGTVSSKYTLKALLNDLRGGGRSLNNYPRSLRFITIPILIAMMYFPAMLYRWNLKSSALLWGGISYVLRPVIWIGEEDMRSKTSCRTSWVLQGLLGSALLGASGWLLIPYFPNELSAILPDKLITMYALCRAPALGLRYVLLWALCISLACVLTSAYCIRSAHDKLLACAADLKGYAGEPLSKFEQQAARVQRWLNTTLAITVLTVWVFALWWALQKWPDQLRNVVWSWIRPWL